MNEWPMLLVGGIGMVGVNIKKLLMVVCCIIPASVGASGVRACASVANNDVLSAYSVSEKGCTKYIEIELTSGESGAATFVIVSDIDADDVVISSGALVGGGAEYQGAISLKYIKSWYRGHDANKTIRFSPGGPLLVPDLLVKDDDFIRVDKIKNKNYIKTSSGYLEASELDGFIKSGGSVGDTEKLSLAKLARGEVKPIWISALLPEGAKPGVYEGKINILSQKKMINQSLGIKVRLLPVRLVAPLIEYSIYYRSVLSLGPVSELSDLRKKQVMLEELKDMKMHGISNPTIYEPINSASSLNEIIAMRKEAGLDNSNLYLLGVNTQDYKNIYKVEKTEKLIAGLMDKLQSSGVHNLSIYGIDEAEKDDLQGQIALWERYRKNGIKIFSATWQPNLYPYLAGNIDVVINGIPGNKAVNDFYKNRGTKPYLYNNPQVGIEDPNLYRRNYGIRAWQFGYDGVMPYAYQHAMHSIWDDFDDPQFRDHVFAYPTSNGVIDTLAWEGFKEGVGDVRYLSTLLSLQGRFPSSDIDRLINNIKSDLTSSPGEIRGLIINQILSICNRNKVAKGDVCL